MQKVAIVYDRVNKWGGAERVLLSLHQIFPKAPLYTSVYDSKSASWAKVFPKIYTSFLQKLPFTKSNHEFLPVFMPLVFRRFNFSKYDLVISVTSEAAKGIKVSGKTKHVCYCLTPTRYLWSGYDEYFKWLPLRIAGWPAVKLLRIWDKRAVGKPDLMIAISKEVQKRIKKYYKRDSVVVFPPVDVPMIHNHLQCRIIGTKEKKYYLLVSRLDYGYKKVDLAIRAFNKLNYPLVIVGTGREEKKLKKMAQENIVFAGRVDDKSLNKYYFGAKALIMPQEEDFGIVAVEAQSRGIPVIAYKKGGALDTVIDGKTGILFTPQTVNSLIKSVKVFENLSKQGRKKFITRNLSNNAKRFSKENFKKSLLATIDKIK